ncbi:DNA internalization-related competence protein ComEC/Rec2 [Alteromonas sediminis]|uniref:DNA internalization-related competence protein ComEC/Rec2 n=1 Tax=Alteromonas sediminis TaxID=2259342 RepID=A0A3N5Y8U5_9ALTE|nr:DNA internalization-related competence protein ComEC/Rec2 [Alteromonas sediminis]RPJ67609.1 DNA internalization-related competence protein ComEC/Rec2 [Alteromonas sediminis]
MLNAWGNALSGFIIVALTSQFWHVLPTQTFLLSIGSLLILLIALHDRLKKYLTPFFPYFAGGTIGFIWFASVGHWYAGWQLPNTEIQQDVTIQGEILSAQHHPASSKYTIALNTLHHRLAKGNVRVSWYNTGIHFQRGQQVQLCVRLKPSHGLQNPMGFDYWRWLVSESIIATGYVIRCDKNALLQPVNDLASTISARLQKLALPGEKWVRALMLADRSQFDKADWSLLQRFGLSHLFALSGLHMGIVFAICWWASQFVWFAIGKFHRQNASVNITAPVLWSTIIVSGGYVVLCAMPLTLVRAWCGMSVVSLIISSNAYISPSQLLKCGLAICLMLFPFSIYGISLYLSFSAVAMILLLLWLQDKPKAGWLPSLLTLLKLQIGLCSLMMGISALVFGNIYWLAPVANIFFIPIITFLIVPACFISLLLLLIYPSAADIVLQPTSYALVFLIDLLQSMNALYWRVQPDCQPLVVLYFLLFLLLLPRFSYQRRLMSLIAICAVLTLMRTQSTPFEDSSWTLEVYDVGQGNALVVRAANTAMLVDTGPSYPSGFSMAEAVLQPNLQRFYPNVSLMGVLTHFDNDHAGGSEYLMESGLIKHWRSPDGGCQRGDRWRLGQVNVRVLWPTSKATKFTPNNRSCVLMVEDNGIRILIPGDIEAEAEQQLLALGDDLSADILIAPHHGSKTSSTSPFINAVLPQYVVFTTGYLNRWHFPHDEVVTRYQKAGAIILNTALDGFVRFELNSANFGRPINVVTARANLQPRWYKSLSTN